MVWIECRFCNKSTEVNEYDFARWSKGELILCKDCYENFKNNISNTRRINF